MPEYKTTLAGINEVKLIPTDWVRVLAAYLRNHEFEIATKTNDFGDLRRVWDAFYPDPPKE